MMPAQYDSDALRHAVRGALDFPDGLWYRDILKKDVCGCALSAEEERAVIDGAVRTAAMARRITAQYGLLAPAELAGKLRLKIGHSAGELREPYLYMGLYEPGSRTITLNDSAISLVRQFIATNGLDGLVPSAAIARLVLLHEIFHALEEETPDIYTRSRMLERKALGVFAYRRGLAGASEVGAVHFSKEMAGISYSPRIYERFLFMAAGRQLSIDFLSLNV